MFLKWWEHFKCLDTLVAGENEITEEIKMIIAAVI
jgi:hypothetical protein